MVTFSMTLTDPNRGSQGHGILKSYISKTFEKTFVLRTKLLKHSNIKPYVTYGMVSCLMTLTDL